MQKDLIKENSATEKSLARTVLVSVFILFVLIGIFSPMARVKAEDTATPATGEIQDPPAPEAPDPKKPNDLLYQNLGDCNIITKFDNCLVVGLYYIFYSIPAMLMTLAGKLLNIVLVMALNSTIYSMDFVSNVWGIVRDLSNIFFILILLYIAIKLILGIGGSEVKKMIANVVIMALLINFSMFFTKVVIDSSNILALIFYNKVTVEVSVKGTGTEDYDKLMDPNEQDVSGGMYSKFDATKMLSQGFFDALKTEGLTGRIDRMNKLGFAAYVGTGATIGGVGTAWLGPGALIGATVGGTLGGLSYITKSLFSSGEIPASIMAGVIVSAGAILIFTTYAFFVAALCFIGRMLELWVLIIFSPFAFMSFALPELKKVDYIGWDAWSKRLLTASFMAPIFMFFLYFICKVINSNIWVGLARPGDKNPFEIMLLIILPALFILILLLQAVKFAKKGSGAFGEMIMKYSKIAGGLALGGALGATAFAGRNAIGGGGGYLANKAASGMNKFGGKLEDKFGRSFGVNKVASGLTSVGAFAQKSSFDVRGVKIAGKDLAGATGMKLGEAQKGGIAQKRKEKIEKREKRADMLKVREDEGLKQNLNKLEIDKQELLRDTSHDIEIIDNKLKLWRTRAADSARASSADKEGIDLNTGMSNEKTNKLYQKYIQELNKHRNAIKDGKDYTSTRVLDEKGNEDIEQSKKVAQISAINKSDIDENGYVKNMEYSKTATKTIKIVNHKTGKEEIKEDVSINELEDYLIPEAKHAIQKESRRRTTAFANRKGSWGKYSSTANKEARYKIIMESKIESKA
jgi:hypothetical protein